MDYNIPKNIVENIDKKSMFKFFYYCNYNFIDELFLDFLYQEIEENKENDDEALWGKITKQDFAKQYKEKFILAESDQFLRNKLIKEKAILQYIVLVSKNFLKLNFFSKRNILFQAMKFYSNAPHHYPNTNPNNIPNLEFCNILEDFCFLTFLSEDKSLEKMLCKINLMKKIQYDKKLNLKKKIEDYDDFILEFEKIYIISMLHPRYSKYFLEKLFSEIYFINLPRIIDFLKINKKYISELSPFIKDIAMHLKEKEGAGFIEIIEKTRENVKNTEYAFRQCALPIKPANIDSCPNSRNQYL